MPAIRLAALMALLTLLTACSQNRWDDIYSGASLGGGDGMLEN